MSDTSKFIYPQFPEFRPIELKDRDFIKEILWKYQPRCSEWTFTNLYIWRHYYRTQWSVYKDWLVVLCHTLEGGFYFMQPIGPQSRSEVTLGLFSWLRDEKGEQKPRIERADERLVSEIKGLRDILIEPAREHFDYVYSSEDLIRLAGRKYHAKKNHINKFLKSYDFKYVPLSETLIPECIRVLKEWCRWRECEKNPVLQAEIEVVLEALSNFKALKIQGGVVLVDGEVGAFSLGELLNDQTVVIHIEKADPKVPKLFAVINQQFCEHQWHEVPYINREQDLGVPGLRKSKLSYHPVSFTKKFTVRWG